VKDLAVNGRDLIALGIPEGPAVGRTLNALLEAVLGEEVPNERDALLALARSGDS
ncbi:MAG: tRNA nucleotidyltransferase, partial [Oscillospiraceae bacterium]|nr:tRNA nucleotidyltransferase [Oscillospiraceae bacterium]